MNASDEIRVLIADDEPGMRLILRKMIGRVEGFSLIGEATNGGELMDMYRDLKPQVVFLDVDMPVMNGVECANRIEDEDPSCILIFATAHEEYRRDAFDVYAFDYLVKPFRVERVMETLNRIRERLATLKSRPALSPDGQKPKMRAQSRMMLKHRDGVTFINMADIVLVQREARATVIYTADGNSYATSDTLAETAERLDSGVFFRCHRSYIINLNYLHDIPPWGRWTYVVRPKGPDHDALITQDKSEDLEKRYE